MSKDKVKDILSNVLGIDAKSISDETAPENVESWDSFNGLMLVSELEREFNVSFSIEDISSVTCVKDIYSALEKHGIEFDTE